MEICKKKGLLYPEILFRDIYEITPDFLLAQNIHGIIFDIDNTIASYETEIPTDRMRDYLFSLRDAGIKIAFVSNNHGGRVTKFNQTLGFPQFCKAGKPSPRRTTQAIWFFNLPKKEILGIGDQLFTDCISAHAAKIQFYLVPPIRDKKTFLFKVKRFLERPFVRSFAHYREYCIEREE